MDKKKLSEILQVRVDSLEKAISRLGLPGVSEDTIPAIVSYYSSPAPRRDPATVQAAQQLLNQLLSTNNIVVINNDNRVLQHAQAEPEQQPVNENEAIPVVEFEQQESTEPHNPGFSLSALLANKEVLAVLVLVGAVAMAKAITAPIFVSVGVGLWWAYILSFYIDLAGFVFVWHKRHLHGKLFAINTALQTALSVGALAWMGNDAVIIAKGISVSACLGIAVHGFSSIISER